jgi:P4 family phage/plasmid primase-like protien
MANNDSLISFLQRYMGYSLTGLTIEERFVFAYGTGRNGNGTFLRTIEKIFKYYASVAAMETFIASTHERHPTDEAKLVGSRLVVAQETQQGRKWDEEKIKALTGGDKRTTRFMRQDFFDYIPTFKLFITGNHKPNLNAVDEAIKRRFLLVPFAVQISDAECNLNLKIELEAELPAILRWAVDGCLEWQRIGLAPPAAVLEATANYFEAEDTIGRWLVDECDTNTSAWEAVGDLFKFWTNYALKDGSRVGSKKAFVATMNSRGFKSAVKGHGNNRVLENIKLFAPIIPDDGDDKKPKPTTSPTDDAETAKRFLRCLRDATIGNEANRMNGCPAARISAWHSECVKQDLTNRDDWLSFDKAKIQLMEAGLIAVNDTMVWIK